MTLSNNSERQAPFELARPTPLATKSSPGWGPGSDHLASSKRFTVRDGFHLKIHNAEAQAVVNAQLSARGEFPGRLPLPESDSNVYTISLGPLLKETTSALSSPKRTERNVNNNNLEDQFQDDASRTKTAVLDQLLQPEYPNQDSGCTSRKDHTALEATTEWLIYRYRSSEIGQRKQRKAEKVLNEILQEADGSQKVRGTRQGEVRGSMRPRYQSTLGSTYTQRVAAARPQRHPSCKYNHHYHGELLQPLTHSTELGLSRSLNDNNKAVDKLPVSLFYPPSISAASTTAGMAFMKPKPSANRLSTIRSMMRHETAVALRSRNLASRMNELRSLPHVLEQMEVLQLWKKQQHIAEHGVNIIARNRATSTFQVLQKPSQTPLLPSATDHKLHQAKKRKQELEAARDQNVQRIVVRWQTRHEQRAERARRVHIQSQWLLVVALSESSKKWLTRFYELHQKRCELLRILMIKRLQRYWRRRTLEQRNSLQLLRSGRGIPLSSAFFRMPVVIRAVTKLQRNIRVWLERKHHSERKENVALIVTAWFEFQDVKFRRIILRFRKRVRDFQVMWRSWRAITAARIKLLLLVWAKVERKAKRRHGIVTFTVPSNPCPLKGKSEETNSELRAGKGSAFFGMVQRSSAESPINPQQHKQLQDMHRHFRNRGAVHMPIGAVSSRSLGPHSPMSADSCSVGLQAFESPDNLHVRQDLQLRSNMEEEFQLVMYDVYTTRQNLIPQAPKPPIRSPLGAKVSLKKCRKFSPLIQSSPLHLPSTNSNNRSVPPVSRKIPHQLKVTVLRKLLSEKRKMYSDARDREREAWAAARKKMRSEAFRYDVLDELAAFQHLLAKYTTFLMLHSITETEMVRLIHQTQIEVNTADSSAVIAPT